MMIYYSLTRALSILFLAAIFILNLIFGMRCGFGYRHYWFFELMHFLGGFFVAMLFASFFDSTPFILFGLAIISAIWESAELAVAKIPRISGYLKRISHQKSIMPEWKDTVFDIILNLGGGVLFLFVRTRF